MSGPKKWVQTRLGRSRSTDKFSSSSGNHFHAQGQQQQQHDSEGSDDSFGGNKYGNGTDRSFSGTTATTANSNSPPRSLGRVSSYEREVVSTPKGSPGTPKKSWERHYKSFLSRKGGKDKDVNGGRRSATTDHHHAASSSGGDDATASLASAARSVSAPSSTLSVPQLTSSNSLGTAGGATSGATSTSHHLSVAGGKHAGETGGHALDQTHRGSSSNSLLALSPGGLTFKVSKSAGLSAQRHHQPQPPPPHQYHQPQHHQQTLKHPSSAPAATKQISPNLIDDDAIDDLPAPPLLTSCSSSGSSSNFRKALHVKGSSGIGKSRSGSGGGGSSNGEKAIRGGSLFKNVFKHNGGGGGKERNDKLEALHRHNGLDASGRHGRGGTMSSSSSSMGNRRKSLSMDDLDATVRRGRDVGSHGSGGGSGSGGRANWNVAAGGKKPSQQQQQQPSQGDPSRGYPSPRPSHRPAPPTYYSHDNAGDVTVRAGAAGTCHPRPELQPGPGPLRGSLPAPQPQRRRLRTHGGTASSYQRMIHRFAHTHREGQAMTTATTTPQDELDESRRSREKRMAFTEFHNSQRFGKDSTSPYLGDDPSVRDRGAYRPGGGGAVPGVNASAVPAPVPVPAPAPSSPKRSDGRASCACESVATEGGGGKGGQLGDEPALPALVPTPPSSPYKSLLEAVEENAARRSTTTWVEMGEDSDSALALAPRDWEGLSNGDVGAPNTPASSILPAPLPELAAEGTGRAVVLDPFPHPDERSSSDGSSSDGKAYLVAPAVLALCPPRVLAALSDGGDGVRPASDGAFTSLGRALARRLGPSGGDEEGVVAYGAATADGTSCCDDGPGAGSGSGWSSGSFVLHRNYLLEYDDLCQIGGGGTVAGGNKRRRGHAPRGYAHLQDSVVHPLNEGGGSDDVHSLRLDFSSSGEKRSSAGPATGKLLLRLSSRDERDRWIAALVRAARLTARDLYDFDDGVDAHVLGRGRYATVRPARWNTGRLRPAASERVLRHATARARSEHGGGGDRHRSLPKGPTRAHGSLTHSRSADERRRNSGAHSSGGKFNRKEYDCALKIVNKAEFLSRVRMGHERSDALTREVAVQSALAAHVRETGLMPSPFLGLRGFFETRDDVVLELELLEGTDLFRYISARGEPLEEAEAARFMRDLLTCLDLMNGIGVAHRDVKPANIFMCSDEDRGHSSVKLGDFGMAAFADPDDGLLRGRCGTPGYVAPEIFRTSPNTGYANKVDVFSVGVTLHVMLCGYEPFYGESEKELVEANKKGRVEFDKCDWAGVSVEGRDLVEKMLHTNPSIRISATDALQHPWIKRRAPSLGSRTEGSDSSPFDDGESCTLS